MRNISIFELTYETFKIKKPIRLVELFAGVGSQAMALRNIGANFEKHCISEWEVNAFKSYKAIHYPEDDTDYSKIHKSEELPNILLELGISNDGKEPMTLEQIERKSEEWQRETYNNIKATKNHVNIMSIKGEDLKIENTEDYCYMLTYSFPCQDLSLAGEMGGMAKGSGTRSGLLWEVERIIEELEELPQVLLMENVPQVLSQANIQDFHLWQQFLESKGYFDYTDTLNARNYGVAQNRDRTFMVSILGEYYYKFPYKKPLDKVISDYLEPEVDEKYYINNSKAQELISKLVESGQLGNERRYADGTINDPKTKDISNCIKARYDAGIGNFKSDGGVVVEKKPIAEETQIKQLGNIAVEKNFSNPQTGRVYSAEGVCPTLNTMQGGQREPKVVTETVKIKQATKKGYIECKIGGVADLSYPESKTRRGRVQENGEISPTITATETGVHKIETPYRIRKLTPKECWRLMGFTDEDFHKAEEVNSNTQLYKQAGNSIVVNVLEEIFKQML